MAADAIKEDWRNYINRMHLYTGKDIFCFCLQLHNKVSEWKTIFLSGNPISQLILLLKFCSPTLGRILQIYVQLD